MTIQFNVGDAVQWTSQSQGSSKTKRGTVHAIVPVGRTATVFIPKGTPKASIKFDGLYSDRERYVIAVPRGGKSVKVDYYCPRPSLLQLVEEGDNQ